MDGVIQNTRVSKKFCNILACAYLQHIYHMTEAVHTMASTCCNWCTETYVI